MKGMAFKDPRYASHGAFPEAPFDQALQKIFRAGGVKTAMLP
jgi:hypothetical protein